MVPIGDATTNRDGIMTRPLFNSRLMLYDVAARKRPKDASRSRVRQLAGRPSWTPDSKRMLFGIGDRVYRSVFAYDVAAR